VREDKVYKANKSRLQKILEASNVADLLDESELNRYGAMAVDYYSFDDSDPKRAGKRDRWEKGQKLVQQEIEVKNTDTIQNAANVKYPLLTTASVQFQARAYPAIVQGNTVVRPKIAGKATPEKLKKAQDVCDYQNWQLFNEIEEWEEDTDRLLIMLPLYGCMFRKVWYSQEKGRLCTKIISPEHLVVPADTQSMSQASRISEEFTLTPRDIEARIRAGRYLPIDVNYEDSDGESEERFLEQHCWMDLDDDGFKEPYIVVVHIDSGRVVRISPNFTMEDVEQNDRGEVSQIKKRSYYVKYTFIPATDGAFYDIGFFDILYPINEVVNTTVNQLLDAGRLANSNGGFISKDIKLRKKGPVKFAIGEYISVNGSAEDIRKGILPMNFPGPDSTLFNLLGFMVEAGRDIANLKEVLEGTSAQTATATTTMALIEQGLKVFSSIYKRIHRSLSKELQLLRSWNKEINDPKYGRVLDVPVSAEDFNDDELDFVPVSDPTVVTDLQKMSRVQFLMQFINDPYFDQVKLRQQIFEGANIDGFEDMSAQMTPEKKQIQQLTQQVQQLTQVLQKVQQTQDFNQNMEVAVEERRRLESKARVEKDAAKAIKDIADAEAAETGSDLQKYQAFLEAKNAQSGNGKLASQLGNTPAPQVPAPGGPGIGGQPGPTDPSGGNSGGLL
jgi:chaperonin GroES